jgi:hypothetical protein
MDKTPLIYYAITLALAFLVEAGVEYVFGTPFDKIPRLSPFKWLLMYLGLAVGIGVTFHYQLDLAALILEESPTWVGILLTGSLIGRGAGFVNDFWQKYLISKKPPTWNEFIGDEPQ